MSHHPSIIPNQSIMLLLLHIMVDMDTVLLFTTDQRCTTEDVGEN